MSSTLPFWIGLAATVALVLATLVSGLRRQRRVHLVTGPLTVGALAWTIVLTERLLANYTFPESAKAIHLPCAKAGGLLVLPVVATGVWLLFAPAARRWRRSPDTSVA
ncbi:MAG: hypothetical protein ACK5BN_07710, partial [Planctomycetota bacterium]